MHAHVRIYIPEVAWGLSGGVGGGRSRKRWRQRTRIEERSLDIIASTNCGGPSENTCSGGRGGETASSTHRHIGLHWSLILNKHKHTQAYWSSLVPDFKHTQTHTGILVFTGP